MYILLDTAAKAKIYHLNIKEWMAITGFITECVASASGHHLLRSSLFGALSSKLFGALHAAVADFNEK